MTKKKPLQENEYPDADKRRDDALRNALSTPAQPNVKKRAVKKKRKAAK